MGGKYKKKLRAEKAKVKLKKKTLPKGQNITNTSFKVKKIITTEQLKKVEENEPASLWNVPLKDLLIHLSHHNKTSRLNGLNGIKEVIANYPNVLNGPSLRSIVIKILELMSDIESKVRLAAVSLLDDLFNELDSSQIEPFYDILNAHLACSMTHRQVAIQKDSLKLADVILKHTPQAIQCNFKIISNNFIRILSAYKYGSQSEIHLTRGSKKDLEDNRIAIFERLYKILSIRYQDEQYDLHMECKTVKVSEVNGCSLRTITNHFKRIPNLQAIFKPQITDFRSCFEDDVGDFEFLVSQIIPILFGTWAEFSPSVEDNGFINECSLSNTTAKLLSLILQIIILLYERILKMDNNDLEMEFKSRYGQQLVKYFLPSFPYVLQLSEKRSTQDSNSALVEEVVELYSKGFLLQNVTICYLVYSLKIKISNDLEKKMENYIQYALSVRNTKCEEMLFKVVEAIFNTQPRRKATASLLDATIKAYKQSTNSAFQMKLLGVLSKIAMDDKYRHLHENASLKEWLVCLARSLLKDKISFSVLLTLGTLIPRKMGIEVLREVESKFFNIVSHIPKVQIEGSDLLEGKKYIVNILYWCNLSLIESTLKSGMLEDECFADVKSYIVNIFTYRIVRSKNSGTNGIPEYVSES